MCKKHKEPCRLFYKILGFPPRNIEFYKTAVIHRSSAIKSESGEFINNERLEFLGDAILGAVISDVLYHHYEHQNEGFLSNTRSKIVQRETLNRIAVNIGLDKMMVTSKKNNIQKDNIYGNAFEALIGAIYLDQGYGRCQEFIINKIFTTYIDLDKITKKEVNFKSRILELAQKHKIEILFNTLQERRMNDGKIFFQTELLMNNTSVGFGTGYSKKESQQDAAKAALKRLQVNKGLLEEIMSKISLITVNDDQDD